ncbi:MAG TPA: hypothetical protein VM345_17775 [Acidimicrobiales bacterium]|nr:hypothetical protein [Acidimicrobiales bacterium]
MTEERDNDLGRKLAALPTPDHGPEFWARLDERLREESSVDELAERRSRRTGRRAAVWLPMAAIAAAVVVLFGVLGARSTNDDPQDRVTTDPADSTATTVAPARAVPQMVTGVAELLERASGDGALEATQEYRFVRIIDGSYATTNTATGETIAYDAAGARTIEWFTYQGKTTATVETNVPPGGPDRYGYNHLGGHDVEQFVVAASRAGLEGTSEYRLFDRPVWLYDGPVAENELAGNGVNWIEATVDQETGILLRLLEKNDDVVVREVVVRTFETTPTPDRSLVFPNPPAGADVSTADLGFVREKSDLATRRQGVLVPRLPDEVEDEWELDSWWWAPKGRITGPEGSNPEGTNVVAVTYAERDTWRRVTVTLRRTGDPDVWDDPFRGEGQVLGKAAKFVYERAEGATVLDPTTVPHTWAVATNPNAFVVTVAGAATPQELVRFAQLAVPGSD